MVARRIQGWWSADVALQVQAPPKTQAQSLHIPPTGGAGVCIMKSSCPNHIAPAFKPNGLLVMPLWPASTSPFSRPAQSAAGWAARQSKTTAGHINAEQAPLAAWRTGPLRCRVMLSGTHLLLHGSLICHRSLHCLLTCRAAFAGNVPLLIRLLKGCSTDGQQQLDSQGNTVSC